MSRIGRRPIDLPKGVDFTITENNTVTVKGPKGTLTRTMPEAMLISNESGKITVSRPDESPTNKSLHGLTRTLVANMVEGVSAGFRKEMEIAGVGYRAVKDGTNLVLIVGYSHPVRIEPPTGITFDVASPTRIAVSGIDKEQVGQVAAKVREVREPEPYKGKGIKYAGEVIRRKQGKAGKTGKGKK